MNIESQVIAQAARLNKTPDELMAIITYMVDVKVKGYDWYPKPFDNKVEPQPQPQQEEIPECVLAEMRALGLSTLKEYQEHCAKEKAAKEAKDAERKKRAQQEAEEIARIEAEIQAGTYQAPVMESLFGTDEPEEVTVFVEMTQEEKEAEAKRLAEIQAELDKELAEHEARIKEAQDRNSQSDLFCSDEEYDRRVAERKAAKEQEELVESLGSDPIKAIEQVVALEAGSPKRKLQATWIKAFGGDIENYKLVIVYLMMNHGKQSGTIEALQTAYNETYSDHADYQVIEKPVKERTPEQMFYAERNRTARDTLAVIGSTTAADLPKAIQGDAEIIDMTKPMFPIEEPKVEATVDTNDLPWEVPEPKMEDGLDMTAPLFSESVATVHKPTFTPEVKERVEISKEDELAQLLAKTKPSPWNLDRIKMLQEELGLNSSNPTPLPEAPVEHQEKSEVEVMEEVTFAW